jgi:(2Fe-2S) ferredoxin/precorrin-6B methylase 2
MEPFRYHVFVCDQKKPDGYPCCSARGSIRVIDALRKEVVTQGLANDVQITRCGSIGLCERGPNMIVYPEGIWYSGVTPADVPEIVTQHFKEGNPVGRLVNHDVAALRSEVETNRNKMLAGLKARDQAGVPPDDFMERIRGFQESRIMLTAVELDIFSAVRQGATASQVAAVIGAAPRSTEMLLNALTAMELLSKAGDRYRNTPLTERFLVAGSPNNIRMSLMHSVQLWGRWSTMTDAVRKGSTVVERKRSSEPDQWTTAFIAAMHSNASARAPQIIGAIDMSGVKRVLDVGGGSGAYSIAFAHAHSQLQVDILDLPAVVPLAQRNISEAGVTGQVHLRQADMLVDEFGVGYDLVFISQICHQFGPDQNRDLFAKSFRALNKGGRIVVQDFILESNRTSPKNAALFSLNMLVGTEKGSSYSEDDYRDWLNVGGFGEIEHVRIPGPTGLMVGKKA